MFILTTGTFTTNCDMELWSDIIGSIDMNPEHRNIMALINEIKNFENYERHQHRISSIPPDRYCWNVARK